MTDKKAKLTGVIVTIVVHAIIIAACLFFALITPLPLPGEEGVEVMLGSNDAGAGDDMFYEAPKPVAPASRPEHTKAEEDIATSNSEEEIFMPKEKTPKSVNQETVSEPIVEPDPEPVVNQAALYKGSSSSNSSSSQSGSSTGAGTAGSIYGSPDSQNTSGLGGSGGGISFSLAGRSSVSMPKPEYVSQDQGKIVVRIEVNHKGEVVKAEPGQKGTTIINQQLWKKTKEAALKTRFNAVSGTSVDKIQIGTITYNFKRVNE
ncbi:MAG: hypothetical protein PHR20_03490 [Bacteroidales bacterium]|nr:hypothetical protein [Bacteroidales bacterium]